MGKSGHGISGGGAWCGGREPARFSAAASDLGAVWGQLCLLSAHLVALRGEEGRGRGRWDSGRDSPRPKEVAKPLRPGPSALHHGGCSGPRAQPHLGVPTWLVLFFKNDFQGQQEGEDLSPSALGDGFGQDGTGGSGLWLRPPLGVESRGSVSLGGFCLLSQPPPGSERGTKPEAALDMSWVPCCPSLPRRCRIAHNSFLDLPLPHLQEEGGQPRGQCSLLDS